MRTDGRTDMSKPIGTFRDCANAPQKPRILGTAVHRLDARRPEARDLCTPVLMDY